MILYIFIPLVLRVTPVQSVCTPISCVTSVHLNVTTGSIRDPLYACRGEQLTFTCEVVNAASLQWAFEPDVPCDMPISYTTGDDEGETKGMGSYLSRLISTARNPPNSNFSSDLTYTPPASMESVTVVCGNQLSFCSSTESELTVMLTDAPVVTQTSLQYYIRSQESCPNISVLIQIDEIQDIATLTYELTVSSSDGCALPECPMRLNPGERVLTITLLNGVNYTATLEVSNDCGTGNTTVSIQPMCEVRPSGPAETQGNRATIGAIVGVVGGGVVGVTITLIVVLVVYFCNKEKLRYPLHSAARYGRYKKVKSLLKKHDVNGKDDKGRTPLHMAARGGHIKIVKHLVVSDAKTDIKDKKQWIPLHMAAKNGNIETLEYLVDDLQKKKIGIDVKDDSGQTPLHIAARGRKHTVEKGRKHPVESLIDKGADFNIKDDSGRTPLHFAAREGHKDTVECLVEKGVDINIRDNYERTPIDIAAEAGHQNIVTILQQFEH